jgi:hypothetical protein
VSLIRGLLAVRLQYGQALANASTAGALKHRKAVVYHQGGSRPVGFALGEVLPEYRVLLGFAHFMAGDDAINASRETGSIQFQAQWVRMAVGNDDRSQTGTAQRVQKSGDVGSVTNAFADFGLQASNIQ